MSANSEKPFAMSSVGIVDQTRSMAVVLVQRTERNTGSRMAAYDAVASSVGVSSSWLRDFIGRNPRVKPDLVVGFNIRTLYRQWCSRVEQEIENERDIIAALQGPIDAADFSALDMVADTTGTSPPPKKA